MPSAGSRRRPVTSNDAANAWCSWNPKTSQSTTSPPKRKEYAMNQTVIEKAPTVTQNDALRWPKW
jgi:hypothetical protein